MSIARTSSAVGQLADMPRRAYGTSSSRYVRRRASSVVEFNEADRSAYEAAIRRLRPTLRQRAFNILNGTATEGRDGTMALINTTINIFLVFASVGIFCAESLPHVYAETRRGNQFQPGSASLGLFVGDTITIACFTVDLVARLVLCQERRPFVLSSTFVIDFLSIIGYYIDRVAEAAGQRNSQVGGLVVLRVLRLTRVLRVFKLGRYSKGLGMVYRVMTMSVDGLVLILLSWSVTVIVFSAVIFYTEQLSQSFDSNLAAWVRAEDAPTMFQSIPHTAWYVGVTMTTVGFGDAVPVAWLSRVVAAVAMLFGVLTLSFPYIIIAAHFRQVHRAFHQERAQKSLTRIVKRAFHCIIFTRRLRNKMEARKSSERVVMSRVASLRKEGPSNYFLARLHRPFTEYDLELPDVTKATVRGWEAYGVTATKVLQRVLEAYSGVCRIDELAVVLRDDDGRQLVAVENLLHIIGKLSEGGYLRVFVLRRATGHCLLSLTQTALDLLLSEPEEGSVYCERSLNVAKQVWHKTTDEKFLVAFDSIPKEMYIVWRNTEQLAPKPTYPLDMKLAEDDAKGGLNSAASFRTRNAVLSALNFMGRIEQKLLESDKARMQVVLGEQTVAVEDLEQELARLGVEPQVLVA